MKSSVTPQDVVDFLNELVKIDPHAMSLLIDARVPCNKALEEHPTVQVMCFDSTIRTGINGVPRAVYAGPVKVGLLGILNGMFGKYPDGNGPIVMYRKIKGKGGQPRFELYTPKQEKK